MYSSRHLLQQHPLPPYLLAAAIDYINAARPKPDSVEKTLTTFALRLGYDATIAAVLSVRVTAAARMFQDPLWPSVRHLGRSVGTAETSLLEAAIHRFICTAPLDADLTFDLRRLLTTLLIALPHKGCA